MSDTHRPIHVIGGGLAGAEAAWQAASAGVPVVLHEMRPVRGTEAHKSQDLAELVCSNSFRSDDANGNAVGLLHQEMRALGSLIMREGDALQGPSDATIVVGAERAGLDAETVAQCTRAEHIPIAGDSLNAAMAATVALYEFSRVPRG